MAPRRASRPGGQVCAPNSCKYTHCLHQHRARLDSLCGYAHFTMAVPGGRAGRGQPWTRRAASSAASWRGRQGRRTFPRAPGAVAGEAGGGSSGDGVEGRRSGGVEGRRGGGWLADGDGWGGQASGDVERHQETLKSACPVDARTWSRACGGAVAPDGSSGGSAAPPCSGCSGCGGRLGAPRRPRRPGRVRPGWPKTV